MRLLHNLIDGSDIEKGCFRIGIHLSVNDGLKAADCFFYRHIFARNASKVLSHMEGLGQESLNLSGTAYCQLVLIRELLHTQNCDDILQLFVFLKHLLHLVGYLVMLLSNDILLQDTGR